LLLFDYIVYRVLIVFVDTRTDVLASCCCCCCAERLPDNLVQFVAAFCERKATVRTRLREIPTRQRDDTRHVSVFNIKALEPFMELA
jgi:hypothetical protein